MGRIRNNYQIGTITSKPIIHRGPHGEHKRSHQDKSPDRHTQTQHGQRRLPRTSFHATQSKTAKSQDQISFIANAGLRREAFQAGYRLEAITTIRVVPRATTTVSYTHLRAHET